MYGITNNLDTYIDDFHNRFDLFNKKYEIKKFIVFAFIVNRSGRYYNEKRYAFLGDFIGEEGRLDI